MAEPTEEISITVVRSGGIAGMRRAWRVIAADGDAADWAMLVEACPWGSPAPVAGSAPRGADRFSWEVATITGTRDQRAVLGDADLQEQDAWRRLIDAVRTRGQVCTPR
ncbi:MULTISPECIES: protealysin inhibitor emfourin [unclassified Microbacterium]|uniref:protealysin inhibitor emfourin n=1 Tax=unclassified Microbacterium TaxID=2609290 RepID=UPI0038708173